MVVTERNAGHTLSGGGARKRRYPVAKVKGGWTPAEDEALKRLVEEHSEGNWSVIARALNAEMGKPDQLGRIGKQCRERWNHHLKPGIRTAAWTDAEEAQLAAAHTRYGNKWSDIARCITGRTENQIKNHWNATLRRKDMKPNGMPVTLKAYMQSINLLPPGPVASSSSPAADSDDGDAQSDEGGFDGIHASAPAASHMPLSITQWQHHVHHVGCSLPPLPVAVPAGLLGCSSAALAAAAAAGCTLPAGCLPPLCSFSAEATLGAPPPAAAVGGSSTIFSGSSLHTLPAAPPLMIPPYHACSTSDWQQQQQQALTALYPPSMFGLGLGGGIAAAGAASPGAAQSGPVCAAQQRRRSASSADYYDEEEGEEQGTPVQWADEPCDDLPIPPRRPRSARQLHFSARNMSCLSDHMRMDQQPAPTASCAVASASDASCSGAHHALQWSYHQEHPGTHCQQQHHHHHYQHAAGAVGWEMTSAHQLQQQQQQQCSHTASHSSPEHSSSWNGQQGGAVMQQWQAGAMPGGLAAAHSASYNLKPGPMQQQHQQHPLAGADGCAGDDEATDMAAAEIMLALKAVAGSESRSASNQQLHGVA